MGLLEKIKSKRKSIIVIALILTMVVSVTVVTSTQIAYAATVDYWEVKLGGDTVAVVPSEAEALDLIESVKNHYVEEGTSPISVELDPLMTVEKVTVKKYGEQPDVTVNTNAVVDSLLEGKTTETTYTVQEGDSLWALASVMNMSLDSIAKAGEEDEEEEETHEAIQAGDEIVMSETEYPVNVTVETEVESIKDIRFKTVYEYTEDMYEDEQPVISRAGKNGSRRVLDLVTTVNGNVVSIQELASDTIEDAVDEVVRIGTKERPVYRAPAATYSSSSSAASSGSTGSSKAKAAAAPAAPQTDTSSSSYETGCAIANYALQFVGYPYVYGGTSLTGGCDCSGFVYSIFRSFGYSVPRTGVEYYGRMVTGSMQPGDIIVYPTHYSIYIGGGMEVSALNPSAGIKTLRVGVVSSSYYAVRVI